MDDESKRLLRAALPEAVARLIALTGSSDRAVAAKANAALQPFLRQVHQQL